MAVELASGYRRQVLSSLAWQGSAQLLGQLISWASTILVIRLLDPGDFGLMAEASLFVSFLLMLADLGVGAAIVQADSLDEKDLETIQGIVFVFNSVGCAITLLASPALAAFFGEPRLEVMLNVLSINFLLLGLYTLPQSMLMRQLRFDRKSKVDLTALIVSSAVSLLLAWMGFGVWSLVAATVTTHVIRVIGFNAIVRVWFAPRLSLEHGRRFLQFGSGIVLSRFLWYLHTNLDVVIAGKVLGAEALGFYSVALSLAALPMQKVMPVLTQVAFPAVSRIQHEPERVRQNMLRALQYGNVVFLPVFWGMAWVAADAIPVLIGEEWQAAILPFTLVAIILPLRAQSALFPPALFGLGRPMVNVGNMAISLVLLGTGFAVGARWGLVGLASAWLLVYPLAFVITTTRSIRVIGLQWTDLLTRWRGALLAAAAMSAAVWLAQLVSSDWNQTARLLTAIAAGAVAYIGTIMAYDRALLVELRDLFSR